MTPGELLDLQVAALWRFDITGRMVAANTPQFEPAPRFFVGRCEEATIALVRADVPPAVAADLLELATSESLQARPAEPPRFAGDYEEALGNHGPVERIHFGPAFWLPPEVELPASEARRLDAGDKGILAIHFPDMLGDLDAGLPIFGVERDGAVVAYCFCARLSDRVSEAGVKVAEAYRGQGLAQACTAGWAAAMREMGRIPFYSTTWENDASRGVARALGFEPYATDWHVS